MRITTQAFRYTVVGLVSNAILYLGYLGLTWAGMGHKLAMSLLYAVGVLQTFVFNKRWSFKHDGATRTALVRYVTAYACGYLLNLVVLMTLVDGLGLPHQWVQGAMICFLAGMLFLLQRHWIFRTLDAHPI